MPTKRQRISRAMVPGVSEVVLHFLSDELFPLPANSENDVVQWRYFTTTEEKEKILAQCRDAILEVWIEERPGTRPNFWWKNDAPEVRRRLSGAGDPASDHLAYAESYDHGIPSIFLDPWLVDYFNGRARDINGKKIGDHNDGDFAGKPVDPCNPPKFESQAAFLKRHELLTPAEKRRLKSKDFQPEAISVDDE